MGGGQGEERNWVVGECALKRGGAGGVDVKEFRRTEIN